MNTEQNPAKGSAVKLALGSVVLAGSLDVPAGAQGLVVFAHGSGSSRLSPRNVFVAKQLQKAGIGTLLFDLLTPAEEAVDDRTAQLRFNIAFLAGRLLEATDWLTGRPEARHLRLGYFGASTGAGAALVAAAEKGKEISAVVSRGGRPDMAEEYLSKVTAPTLLIVGGEDYQVIDLNQMALARLKSVKKIVIIPGATHLFEEPGALERVALLATAWFKDHFKP
jgi:putative phosphoribosyl transferase